MSTGMADSNLEKTVSHDNAPEVAAAHDEIGNEKNARPSMAGGGLPSSSAKPDWRHRRLRLGRLTLPAYTSPPVQLVGVSLVRFLCPGIFNVLQGIGGGGQVDALVANRANTALYATFSIVGFFAGSG